jgi:carbonic anhydrase
MELVGHSESCLRCAEYLRRHFSPRRSPQPAGAAGAAATLRSPARTAQGSCDAMILYCMDPRVPEPVRAYTHQRGLTGKFSQVVIAGAAIGVVAPKFKDWHKTFWDNLAASIQLHNIPRVIAINHRDCGAAKIAYGAAKVANATRETETHRAALAQFRREMGRRHPKLAVETYLMALDGSLETFS